MRKLGNSRAGIGRRALIAGASVAALLAVAGPSRAADDISGDLVLLNWASGSELDMIKALGDAFEKAHPGVHFKRTDLTTQGDQRGAIRAALQSGEKADIFINTWPAFRKELADAGMLRDLGPLWDKRQYRRQPVGQPGRTSARPTARSTASPIPSATARDVLQDGHDEEGRHRIAAQDLGRVPRQLRQAQGGRRRRRSPVGAKVLGAHRVVRDASTST